MPSIANLKKAEIVRRANFRCIKHKHNGLSHPNCYTREIGGEKIGFLDIEASNLNANFGICLSYCIKELNGPTIKRVVTPKEIKSGVFDKRLMEQFCIDAKKFTRLVTFYGSRFDIPFLRTRCLHHKIQDFPVYKEIAHSDLYMMARGKVKLHSKRLAVMCDFFGIDAKNHPLNWDIWLKCLSGDKAALDYVLVHNVEDVVSTEKLWKMMEPFIRVTETSI